MFFDAKNLSCHFLINFQFDVGCKFFLKKSRKFRNLFFVKSTNLLSKLQADEMYSKEKKRSNKKNIKIEFIFHIQQQ